MTLNGRKVTLAEIKQFYLKNKIS